MSAAPESRRLLWAGGTSLVIHGGVAAALFLGFANAKPAGSPPAALVIEMASLPSSPPVPPADMPPEPEQKKADPEPVKEQPKLPPIPKAPPNVTPEAPVPFQEKKEEKKEQAEKPAEQTTHAAAPPAPPKEKAAAPAIGAPSNTPSNAEQNWESRVLAALERKKRYPAEAQSAGQQDTVYVRITVDREGRVTAAAIRKSRGFALLDGEVNSLVRRASPLPKPPKEVPGDTISLLVPVEFFIKRR